MAGCHVVPRRARRSVAAIALAATITLSPLAAVAQTHGPEGIADVAEKVIDAVVNISTSQMVEARGNMPQMPPGSQQFEEFFEEFFKNKRGGDNQNRAPRRVSSLGSGFIIDPSGIVVTNNHVIADADEVNVILNDGTRLKAEVIGHDQKTDIALVRVKPDKPLKAMHLGDSDKLRLGEWVVAIGNPFSLGGTVTAGIVSARNRDINSGPYDNYIQTDAAINRGNSGGPLFNLNGEVVGVNTAIISPSGGSIGIGFAVPSKTAVAVIDQLRQFDETGDVIVKFAGKDVKEMKDLPRIVADTPVGKDVEVVIIRKGQEAKKTVKLGRLEDGEKQATLTTKKDDQSEEKSVVQKTLGLQLSNLTDSLRQRYKIKDQIKGVVITGVDANSAAAEKRLSAGDVIVEVAQEPIATPADLQKKLDQLKKDGRKSALFLVANADGELRFVALGLQ